LTDNKVLLEVKSRSDCIWHCDSGSEESAAAALEESGAAAMQWRAFFLRIAEIFVCCLR
jgi:hypothetical protein